MRKRGARAEPHAARIGCGGSDNTTQPFTIERTNECSLRGRSGARNDVCERKPPGSSNTVSRTVCNSECNPIDDGRRSCDCYYLTGRIYLSNVGRRVLGTKSTRVTEWIEEIVAMRKASGRSSRVRWELR